VKTVYKVVRPDLTLLSEHTTLTAAIRAAREAKQLTGSRHQVYGQRPDGIVVHFETFV